MNGKELLDFLICLAEKPGVNLEEFHIVCNYIYYKDGRPYEDYFDAESITADVTDREVSIK